MTTSIPALAAAQIRRRHRKPTRDQCMKIIMDIAENAAPLDTNGGAPAYPIAPTDLSTLYAHFGAPLAAKARHPIQFLQRLAHSTNARASHYLGTAVYIHSEIQGAMTHVYLDVQHEDPSQHALYVSNGYMTARQLLPSGDTPLDADDLFNKLPEYTAPLDTDLQPLVGAHWTATDGESMAGQLLQTMRDAIANTPADDLEGCPARAATFRLGDLRFPMHNRSLVCPEPLLLPTYQGEDPDHRLELHVRVNRKAFDAATQMVGADAIIEATLFNYEELPDRTRRVLMADANDTYTPDGAYTTLLYFIHPVFKTEIVMRCRAIYRTASQATVERWQES